MISNLIARKLIEAFTDSKGRRVGRYEELRESHHGKVHYQGVNLIPLLHGVTPVDFEVNPEQIERRTR